MVQKTSTHKNVWTYTLQELLEALGIRFDPEETTALRIVDPQALNAPVKLEITTLKVTQE